jgi:hypothetical protein
VRKNASEEALFFQDMLSCIFPACFAQQLHDLLASFRHPATMTRIGQLMPTNPSWPELKIAMIYT